MDDKIIEEINIRRSLRIFTEKRVEEEKVERILRAAMQAPSAGNQQGWEFIVVRDRKKLEILAGLSPYARAIGNANLGVVLLGNSDEARYDEMWQQDLSAATQNILLQCTREGLGGVWISVAPIEDRMFYVRHLFDLPDNIKPFAIIPIGYVEEEKGNKFVDRWNKDKVFYEEYKK